MGKLTKFVDRKSQLDCFDDLLKFKDDARVLAVQDGPGMGKTLFLEKLQSHCKKIEPRVPVVFIDLQQLDDYIPFHLLRRIKDVLNDSDVLFPRFEDFCNPPDNRSSENINFSINLTSNMSIQDNNFEDVDHLNISSPIDELKSFAAELRTPKQVKRDEKTGERAFLDDLRDYCQNKPVVFLLDHYERCPDEKLKEWVVTQLLEHYFFNVKSRPKKLLLVITGQKEGLPSFGDNWSDVICQQVIRWIEELGPWPLDELSRFIDLCQASVSQDDRTKLHDLMTHGFSTQVISAMVEDRAHRKTR